MDDVDNIKVVALTAENTKADPILWTKVNRGEYDLVYATPEVLMDKRGHFATSTVRKPGRIFLKNLVAVAVDECHLIWDWLGFRNQYSFIGNLRLTLNRVPFVCMSATLMPNVATYVHEVCCLQSGTVRIKLSTKRDNINLVVSQVDNDNLDPLLGLIPDGIRDPLQIPKTVIFHDKVEAGIAIANQLLTCLPRKVGDQKIPRDTIVASYYSSLDYKMKLKILGDFLTGRTCIIVCTDAFGLGVDIPNIQRVIHWHVDEKLAISSLNQRMGRAVRNEHMEGVVVVYV